MLFNHGWYELPYAVFQAIRKSYLLNLIVFCNGNSNLLIAGPTPTSKQELGVSKISHTYTTEVSGCVIAFKSLASPQPMRNGAFPYCLLSSWELRTGTGRGLPAESLRQSHRCLPASWPHPCYGFSLMFPGAVQPCDKRCSANRAKLRSC